MAVTCEKNSRAGGVRGPAGASDFRQAKIQHLGMTTIGDKNIPGLDVAMNDALGVCRVQRVGDFDGERQQRVQFHRTPGDQVLQGHALQIFHGDERLAVFLANVVNGADVGMVQRGRGLRLPLETAERLGVLSDVVREEFKRNKTVQPGVFGFVNHTHPAAAQLRDNLVVRDGLPDHELEQAMLGAVRWQVNVR